ncbi:MAG: hypothetical protein HXY41_16390 [Chloroflexi bacterium]|nr:hypothetical protein [Chloroflexota bacterium]
MTDEDRYDDDPEFLYRRVRRSIPEEVFYGDDENDDEPPPRFWTLRRVIYLLLILLTLLAFLVYSFWYLFEQPPALPPTPTPYLSAI